MASTWIIRKARKSESLPLLLRQGFFLLLLRLNNFSIEMKFVKTTDISNIEFVDNAYLCIRIGEHRNSARLVSIKPGNQSGATYGFMQHFAYQPYATIISSRKGTPCQFQMDSK